MTKKNQQSNDPEAKLERKRQFRIMIGNNIRNARNERNMSIDELAEVLEITPGFVGLIERGDRGATSYTIFKLAETFGTSPDAFYRGTGSALGSTDYKQSLLKKLYAVAKNLPEDRLEYAIDSLKGLRRLD